MEREVAVERIVSVLQPYLGATMAVASTRAHCDKLGIAPGAVSAEQVETLLAKLKGGLAVFVGDILYAYVQVLGREGLGPLVDATYVPAYLGLALGKGEQRRLLGA